MFSQAYVCPLGGMGACMAGGVCGGGACMTGETATAADGTHPTGMHSCFRIVSKITLDPVARYFRHRPEQDKGRVISTPKTCGLLYSNI